MKKLLSVIAACLTAGALLVGCGSESPSDETKIGVITGLNVTEQAYNDKMRKLEEKADIKFDKRRFVYHDDLNSMQMSLDSGNVDELSMYGSVARYMVERDPDYVIPDDNTAKVPMLDKFCCAVKAEDKELLTSIDGAIKSMADDGTLDGLIKKYIDDVKGEPEAVAMPSIEGAPTLKVAVTGDLPPLDLIRADGTPAGFNTAMIAELGRRINKNVELVSVGSLARATALMSGKADIVFWMRVPNDESVFPADFDRPEGVAVSEPYFVDEVVHIAKKK